MYLYLEIQEHTIDRRILLYAGGIMHARRVVVGCCGLVSLLADMHKRRRTGKVKVHDVSLPPGALLAHSLDHRKTRCDTPHKYVKGRIERGDCKAFQGGQAPTLHLPTCLLTTRHERKIPLSTKQRQWFQRLLNWQKPFSATQALSTRTLRRTVFQARPLTSMAL